jgi:hypothetical protein
MDGGLLMMAVADCGAEELAEYTALKVGMRTRSPRTVEQVARD